MLCSLWKQTPTTGGRFYASNGGMVLFSAWNYLSYTGDYGWLDQRVGQGTMLEHLRQAAHWHKTPPQWNGLAHCGKEANLFDDITVSGCRHFVAAPNAADVSSSRKSWPLSMTARSPPPPPPSAC